MADKVLGSFKRPRENSNDIVQAAESEFKGQQYFSFRVWWKDENDEGKMKPSKNGINLTFDEREAFAHLVAEVFPQYLTFHTASRLMQPAVAAGSAPDA